MATRASWENWERARTERLAQSMRFPSLEVRGSAWETGNTSVEETGRASHSHRRGTRGDVKQCVVHAVHVTVE